MNEFLSWCRHLLVSFLFHALISLHPPSFHDNTYDDTYDCMREQECSLVPIILLIHNFTKSK